VTEQRPREVVHWAGVARAGSLRWISAALVVAGAVLFAASCLNPRPDDMPSTFNEGPSAQPSNPGAMLPTGDNPGIGGDNLVEEPPSGQVPLDPNESEPDFPRDDSDDPNEASGADAGAGPGIDPTDTDAGPDGG
jgi:hypothetical protein